nr:MAG TPA: hypothetical protein [Caudoviricetes sp.]
MLLYNTPALWSNVSFEVCDRCVRRSRVCFLLQTLVVRQLSTQSHFTIRNALHWHCVFLSKSKPLLLIVPLRFAKREGACFCCGRSNATVCLRCEWLFAVAKLVAGRHDCIS